eukprot:9089057-Alexandrium_andersonii.AAC.1
MSHVDVAIVVAVCCAVVAADVSSPPSGGTKRRLTNVRRGDSASLECRQLRDVAPGGFIWYWAGFGAFSRWCQRAKPPQRAEACAMQLLVTYVKGPCQGCKARKLQAKG